jgi:hypothetical protein
MLRYQVPEYIIPVSGKWQKISDAWLRELETSNRKKYNAYDDYICRYQKNPLSFFLPHGKLRNDGSNDGLRLMNDSMHDLILLTAGNQFGKSMLGAAYTSLRCIPTDKSWHCFTQHKIIQPPWRGQQQVIISSYSWDEVNTVWDTYRKLLPREMMGPYSPYWPYFPGEKGKPKDLRFHNATKRIKLECDTMFTFLSYVQSLTHWEGKQCDLGHLDEQCPEDKFDALTARQTTRGGEAGFTPIIMTLTGHVVPERPDTGAAGWIKRKIVDANLTKGRKVAQYRIGIEDVPDVIISQEKKRKMRVQWVDEPTQLHDEKKLREAEARYWGGWETGGGIVLNEWNPDFHWITPFDVFKYQPTLYRMIDHGQNPCACGWFAVMPWGDEIVFQEYYEFGKNIYNNAAGIVERSGNDRKEVDYGDGMQTYEEVFVKMDFRSSELDCRSFAKKADESGKPIGRVYNESGLSCVPASGIQDRKGQDKAEGGLIPLLKEHLAIRKDRLHIDYRLKRGRDESLRKLGAPKLYIFNTCINTKAEVESWTGLPKQADHLCSCLKFMCATDRPYLGDYGHYPETKEVVTDRHTSITGY